MEWIDDKWRVYHEDCRWTIYARRFKHDDKIYTVHVSHRLSDDFFAGYIVEGDMFEGKFRYLTDDSVIQSRHSDLESALREAEYVALQISGVMSKRT